MKAANKIISGSNEIVNIAIEGIFEIYEAENEADEADWVCNKINELISVKEHDDIEGDIAYEKIAILARNRYVFNQLEEKLTRKEIPFYYKMSPGYLKFESDIMKNFDMAFRVKLNNRDTLHWDSLIQSLKVNSIETVDLNKLIKSLKNLLENFKEYIKKSQNIVNDNEKKMILDDIEELLKHWHNYAKKTDNKSLGQFKNSIALGQTHPLTQHKGITLSTVHTMKGQETDIVFIIGADDETFPDYRALKDEAAMKQEKNNLYVAFTRAKRFLYVSYPKRRTMPWGDIQGRRISRFLENIG
ncbi:MAG: ATP-binding domain-containing protein [Deltaproteobacteria bacterium]|nr:ATP-binding domain-containing protein [Deltaproteobacteria bacterium]